MAASKPFVVNAFTKGGAGGNPAGVVWLENAEFPAEEEMQQLAAELAYSETAFIRLAGKKESASHEASDNDNASLSADLSAESNGAFFETRYFTPVAEVDLCGHATIGAFTALLSLGVARDGCNYTNSTKAGELSIKIVDGCVFMEAGGPIELAVIKDKKQLRELYEVMGLDFSAGAEALPKTAVNFPAIVSTGLPDIMLPVGDSDALMALSPDFEKLAELSESYGVVGVHAFVSEPSSDGWRVRNFAPLYGIDEESATGTANAALAYRLYRCGEAAPEKTLRFVQGESMGLPSEILCSVEDDSGQCRVWVGGEAVIA